MKNKAPLVSIHMITYNHEKYIEQAIEGVLMQECNFNFELIISDDKSSDETHQIIKKIINSQPLPKKIKYFPQQENLGMLSNYFFTLSKCQGKFIAFCEGDDYWIDSKKLQKQVDFLESQPDYGLSCTACDRYYQELDVYIKANIQNGLKRDINFEKLLFTNSIKTCTTVIRSSLVDQYIQTMKNKVYNFRMADAPLWLFVSMKYKIKYHNDSTAVYRILESSATNVSAYKKLLFRMSRYKVSWFFLKQKFSVDLAIKLLIKFLKETPVLILKTVLSNLKLYEPDKQKVIDKKKTIKIK